MNKHALIVIILVIQYNLYGQTFIVKTIDKGKIVEKTFPNDFRKAGLNLNDEFPNFEYKDFLGNAIRLSDYRDKLIVINFWFVGCVGCRQEEPYLKRLTTLFKNNSNISFISFCNSKPAKTKKYIEKYGDFGYKVIPFDNSKTIAEKFKVTTYATHMIIKDGKVVENFTFPITTDNELNWYIERINNEL
jgi:peroxiredoxin